VPPRPPPPSKKQLQQLNHQLQHQQNSNVISNADDIDRIRTLQELGLPADEIQEIDRRITQEQKDEVNDCFFLLSNVFLLYFQHKD
jgi:hypothetical protein